MRKLLFLGILCIGAYMDHKSKELNGAYLLVSFMIGSIFAVRSLVHNGSWLEILLSCGVGVGVLGVSYMTDGGIGEGDGWFFIISGLFLTWEENLFLLCFGWFLCFLYSLTMVGMMIGRRMTRQSESVPFLPFLVPAGLYLVCFSG